MEAMVLSKPVVATDAVGTHEVVVHNHTGYLVPLGSVKQMASKIIKLCADPNLRFAMGHAGHNRALEHFHDREIAAMLHDFYIAKYLYRMQSSKLIFEGITDFVIGIPVNETII
jgi:glycosyltransferase involved in cell wall biosynthesis